MMYSLRVDNRSEPLSQKDKMTGVATIVRTKTELIARSFYLTDFVWELARLMGDGSASKGIRDSLVWANKNNKLAQETAWTNSNKKKKKERGVKLTETHLAIARHLGSIPLKSTRDPGRYYRVHLPSGISKAVIAKATHTTCSHPVTKSKIEAILSLIRLSD